MLVSSILKYLLIDCMKLFFNLLTEPFFFTITKKQFLSCCRWLIFFVIICIMLPAFKIVEEVRIESEPDTLQLNLFFKSKNFLSTSLRDFNVTFVLNCTRYFLPEQWKTIYKDKTGRVKHFYILMAIYNLDVYKSKECI